MADPIHGWPIVTPSQNNNTSSQGTNKWLQSSLNLSNHDPIVEL